MSVVPSLLRSQVIPHIAATTKSRSFLALFKEKVTKMHLQTSPSLSTYEGWIFNSGKYLFTTDTK